jgi:hypothetical protein
MHPPSRQKAGSVHGLLHAPQCWLLVRIFTQVPLQCAIPFGQVQLPPTHVLPAPQGLPHPPQCVSSEAMSTHVPEQLVEPSVQDASCVPEQLVEPSVQDASCPPVVSGARIASR